MNEKKEGVRRVHPDLKRLYQPITEKARSEPATFTLQSAEENKIDTWQGFLLSSPNGRSLNSAAASTDLIEHDFKDVDEAGSFVCTKQLRRKDLTNSYRLYGRFVQDKQLVLFEMDNMLQLGGRVEEEIMHE